MKDRQLTPRQRACLPSDEDVAFYQEHGWYISKVLFTEEELDDALYGVERHYAGERDAPLLITGYLNWTAEDGDVLRLNDYVSLQNDQLRDLVWSPVLGAVAARLAQSPRLRLFHDQLVYKPPGGEEKKAAVGWHSDRAYWDTCTSDHMLTAWIPFHDCDERMGTITMIDGSHKWPGTRGLRTFREQDLEALERRFETGGQPIVKVPMRLAKGQVSFHHACTLHGSYPNLSQDPRIALAVHLQDETNRFHLSRDERGNPKFHIIDTLCRKDADGNPDYTDPDVCPVLWSSSDGEE
jgi:hypothetical protein